MNKISHFARSASEWFGTPSAILFAVGSILVWGILGFFAGFGAQWQMLGNIAISIITYLMVFLIQNTQNHDQKAMNEKINELILALNEADNEFIGIEKQEAEVLENLAKRHEDV